MATNNRAGRRQAAKAAGVKGQLVATLTVVPQPVTAVTLAGAILGVVQQLEKKGGIPTEHAVVTIGSDHPEHPGELVVEGKTDRMQRRANLEAAVKAPLTLGPTL